MPYRDFKGNAQEAMNKLLRDLRTFGFSGLKNLKSEQLVGGVGEHICEVITELINLELYRRNFQFLQPIFPSEDDDEQNLEQNEEAFSPDKDRDFYEFTVNNGRVEPTETGQSNQLLFSTPRKKRLAHEETKTGFY